MTDLQSFTLMMASAQVVETSVNTNNSPSQNYTTNPDDHLIWDSTEALKDVSERTQDLPGKTESAKYSPELFLL